MGASGNIGTELAARAAPDGYTIPMGNVAPNAINVSLFKNLAPAHTPRAVIARLHVEIVKILARSDAARAARRPRLRTGRQLARGIPRLHKIRNHEAGKNNPGRGHPAGMIPAARGRTGMRLKKRY